MKSKKRLLAFFSQIMRVQFQSSDKSLIKCKNATALRYFTTQKAF
ncbi:hypothetical protein N405_01755 [Helicobacter pylori FD568]|nr:hypothetical protein N405_01755 [Helicobacter pylori FD568]